MFQLTSSVFIAQVGESPHIANAHHVACCCQNIFPFLPPLSPVFIFLLHLCVTSSVPDHYSQLVPQSAWCSANLSTELTVWLRASVVSSGGVCL